MRIHIATTSTRFSGGRLALLRHGNELGRRGHAVTVWVTSAAPGFGWMELSIPVRGWTNHSWVTMPAADVCLFDRPRLALPLWRARRGAVVHVCQGFEGTDAENRITAVFASRLRRGGLPELWRSWRRLREIDRAYSLPTAKIVTHRHLGELIARRYRQSSIFVPYGLPRSVFAPPAYRDYHDQSVLVVGPADTGWKRIGDALEAVRLLKKVRPGVRLVRVAQHPMREAERSKGVTDEYHTMLGPEAMADLYRRADVVALASDATEGFGLPALEAMACGTPLVLTDIPAFRTFAAPDDYAHFVPVGRPDLMAQALARLLDDPAERHRLSVRGQAVAARYTIERSFDAMESALVQIVASEPVALQLAG
jgi:glycosyltransferase involved in cell wall biosynthesis